MKTHTYLLIAFFIFITAHVHAATSDPEKDPCKQKIKEILTLWSSSISTMIDLSGDVSELLNATQDGYSKHTLASGDMLDGKELPIPTALYQHIQAIIQHLNISSDAENRYDSFLQEGCIPAPKVQIEMKNFLISQRSVATIAYELLNHFCWAAINEEVNYKTFTADQLSHFKTILFEAFVASNHIGNFTNSLAKITEAFDAIKESLPNAQASDGDTSLSKDT